MCTMGRDWDRLGRTLAVARKAAGLTQGELAANLDLARATIQKVERGHEYGKITSIHRAIARRVGWTEDSIETVLAGGEPTLAEAGAHAPPTVGQAPALDSVLDELSERVRLALLGGRVVDGDVIDLAPDDPDSVAVLILKRGERPNATPEQMRSDLRKWSALQRAAREIFSDDDSDQ